jgi:hypothetical protein
MATHGDTAVRTVDFSTGLSHHDEDVSCLILKRDVDIKPFLGSCPHITHFAALGNHRVALNAPTADLLSFLRVRRTVEELNTFLHEHKLPFDAHSLYIKLTASALKSFVTTDQTESNGGTQAVGGSHSFFRRREVLSAAVVAQLARRVTWLLEWHISLVILFVIAASHYWFFTHASRVVTPAAAHHLNWLIIYSGVYAAVLLHEFGHAAAACKFQIPVGSIGIGMYLIWPVFYSDVSASWQLPRRQRLVIDVAGIYFHSVAASVFIVLYAVAPRPELIILVKSILLSTIINVNPFFRFDGYWILTDLTGIANLHLAGMEVLKQYCWFGRTASADVDASQLRKLRPSLQCVIAAHSVAAWLFLTYASWRVLHAIPMLAVSVWEQLVTLIHLAPAAVTVGLIVHHVVTLLLCSFGIYQLLLVMYRRLGRLARPVVRRLWD